MGKRASQQKSKKARKKSSLHLRTWQLILIFIPLAFITATSLRVDHLRMVDLRNAVLAADEKGDDKAIQSTLEDLRQFTLTHIVFNTVSENGKEEIIFGTGPFYLEKQYTRKAQTELEKAREAAATVYSSNPNGNIFQKAADVCDALGKQHGWRYPDAAYIDCFQNELQKYPTTDESRDFIQAMVPSTALYRQEFSSPIWTPSLSGFLILTCFVLAIIIIVRILFWIFILVALLMTK